MLRIDSMQIVVTLSALAFIVMPHSAMAQGESGNVCVRDYRSGAVCTANDVRIEDLIVVSVIEDCASGTPGETEVVFEALVSSAGSPDRYDIGLFLALEGGSARDGDSCYHDFLSGPLTSTPTYGDKNMDMVDDLDGGPWWDGDTDSDSCGDLEANTQVFTTLPALRFSCIDNNGDGSADIAVCTSWDNNTGTTCNAVTEAFPGTNSKCSCGGVELGIAPEPQITVVKKPDAQNIPPGGTASFTFRVSSRTTISNVVVSDNPPCDTLSGPTGDTNNDNILTPDETWTYDCEVNNVMVSMDTVTVTGDGPLGAVMDTDTARIVIIEKPEIGLAKRVTSITDVGGGQFDVAIEMVVENFNLPFSSVQVTDDLTATFPAPATFVIQAGPAATGTLTANVGYDGNADQNLLNAAASSLATGATATITFTVRVAPNGAPGPFYNTATATGMGKGDSTDSSDDGADPDPDGDGNPNEPGENDPTPINLAEDPVIGVAKRVTSISDAGAGRFDVAIEMAVENLGNVALTYVQVSDDLTATFPAPATFAIQAGPAATGTLTANAGFNGAGDQNLLNAGASSLAIGASSTITFTVRFNPNGAAGPFSNTATASGDSPGEAIPTDTSDDGADPDPDGDGNPDEAGENDPTPISVPENPVIGVSKRVTSVTNAGGGQFDAAIEMVVENLGNVPLSNVQVSDDLTATFPAPATFAIQAGPAATGTLTANAGFNGAGDQNLLNAAASSLAVGASATVTFTVRFNPNGASGPFFNSATADGDSPGGANPSDTSDDGADPDPDGDGNPDEPGENDATPLSVPENPVIGLAKRVTSVTNAGGGQFDAAIEMVVENLGNVALSNLQVTDDLTATFPAPTTFAIQAGPAATGTLTANAGFNGAGDQSLLNAGASSLAAGATATITFTVRFSPNGASGPFSNSAIASGDSPLGSTTTDTSDDGTDPDPDGDGEADEPGENDPTPINFIEDPLIGVAKQVTSITEAGGGQFDVAIEMVVENLGDVPLSNVQVTDDLTAAFPAPATFAIQAGPAATGTLTANAGFNGDGDQNLLNAGASNLAVATSASITFTVRFNPNGAAGPFFNTATAIGQSPGGASPSDTSDDGADPDPDGDGQADEQGENDPTQILTPLQQSPAQIPSLSEWASILLALLLASAAVHALRSKYAARPRQ